MPRSARHAPGGFVFHCLNRGVGRRTLFRQEKDFDAFERVLAECLATEPGVGLLAYCIMSNHWHLLLRPAGDGQLARFMQRLTITHSRRWQEHYREVGLGHVYQGRFKSFPVQEDPHFLTVARYVERNPVRAKLVKRAEAWRWGSLWRRRHGGAAARAILAEWPVDRPPDYLAWVNRPQTAAEEKAELAALRLSVARGRPFGAPAWQERTAEALGLQSTLRPNGRPRKRLTVEATLATE